MLLVNSTMFRNFFLICFLYFSSTVYSQENSPYSRYGLGDLYPGQSVSSRAMGGLSAAFADAQAINSSNPASYGNIKLVTYDIGISLDSRTLRDNNLVLKYTSTNLAPSYFQFGAPLNKRKGLGFAFGLKPLTRINYSIESTTRSPIDSLQTLYEGNGGLNQGYVGIGKRWKNLSIGFNTGFDFGRKELNTKVNFINDTVLYYQSISSTTTAFWGTFLNGGIQYNLKVNEHINADNKTTEYHYLRFGGDVSIQQKLHANQDINRETFEYDANGAIVKIDSVYTQTNILGKINLPTTYTAGFMFIKTISSSLGSVDKWMFGAEYDAGKWNDYRFYGQPDRVVNNWMIRAGGQFTPDPLTGKGFFNRATYRAGFFTGRDYINADNNDLKITGVTVGAAFHVSKFRSYDN